MHTPFRLVLSFVILTGTVTLNGATPSNETGARLLLAELPAGTTIRETDCDLLAKAVHRATITHRAEAQTILTAALAGIGGKAPPRKDQRRKDMRHVEEERSCPCIRHIVHESVVAAPEQSAFLLEIALAFYPECADTLEHALDDVDAGSYEATGFGVGFGPGFPGSPGFSGSTPSSATALPTPASETSVVNG